MFRKREARPSEPPDSFVDAVDAVDLATRDTERPEAAGGYDAYFWMSLLAGRLARRDRLRALDAPEDILQAEDALVEEAKKNLSPGHILYILSHRLDATTAGDPS
jgi:hypothetical protein